MSSSSGKMRCHYDVMGLPRDANADDIKKQYRKLALQWHPDRNRGQEELATQTFKEISSAYEVLSDPQERKWYDDHREAILRGRHPGGDSEEGDEDEDEYTINVWQFFNRSCFSDFDDSPRGFFTVYRELFERIYEQEKAQSAKGPVFPSFGSSDSLASDVYLFYAHWDNFVTSLTFSWADKYNILEAPNRQVKRAMEKENSKFRDDARKEYINKIRSLVAYVKKRDIRYLNFEEEKQKRKKEEEARKEEQKKAEKERRKELREQWKNSQEDTSEQRQEERKGAFLLADNDSEDEMYRGGSSRKSRKGRSGKGHKRFDEDFDEEQSEFAPVSGAQFEQFESEGVKRVVEGVESISLSVDNTENNEPSEKIIENPQNAPLEGEEQEDDAEGGEGGEEEDDEDLFECEVCSKKFKSEAQLTQHLSSKAHRAKVKEMQKQSSKKGKKN